MRLLAAHSTASLIDNVHQADIFDLCERVYRAGVLVDMILCDLPYGTTACAWDTVIPFEPMWKWFKRIVNPSGAIVLTASQPFTSALVMSNPKMFRYEWIWEKSRPSDSVNANRRPLKKHENVLIFSVKETRYFPQMNPVMRVVEKPRTVNKGEILGKEKMIREFDNNGLAYPTTLLPFANSNYQSLHPTQKPVALFDYLIRTYTQIGDIVFDPTAGSGTTAVAARGCNRRYIVGDREQKYVDVMRERLAAPYQLDLWAHTAQRESA